MKVKMTIREALAIRGALQNCDGHQVIIKENGTDKSVFCFYEISFENRYVIAKNIEKLNVVNATYIKSRDDLVRSLAANKTAISPEEKEAVATFYSKEAELLAKEINVDIEKISKAGLEKSNIPASILASLMSIIKE